MCKLKMIYVFLILLSHSAFAENEIDLIFEQQNYIYKNDIAGIKKCDFSGAFTYVDEFGVFAFPNKYHISIGPNINELSLFNGFNGGDQYISSYIYIGKNKERLDSKSLETKTKIMLHGLDDVFEKFDLYKIKLEIPGYHEYVLVNKARNHYIVLGFVNEIFLKEFLEIYIYLKQSKGRCK